MDENTGLLPIRKPRKRHIKQPQQYSIITKYLASWYKKYYREDKRANRIPDIIRFEGLPVKIAQDLMTGYPNVNPKERQNFSPTMRKLVFLAKHHKGTLGGYMIPVETKRWDARITFDTLLLPNNLRSVQIRNRLCLTRGIQNRTLCPNETNLNYPIGKRKYHRLWWD